jgi:hypothetical protein
VRVEELARVIRIVAGLLEPEGKVGVVEPLTDKLGISACFGQPSIAVVEEGVDYREAGSHP